MTERRLISEVIADLRASGAATDNADLRELFTSVAASIERIRAGQPDERLRGGAERSKVCLDCDVAFTAYRPWQVRCRACKTLTEARERRERYLRDTAPPPEPVRSPDQILDLLRAGVYPQEPT